MHTKIHFDNRQGNQHAMNTLKDKKNFHLNLRTPTVYSHQQVSIRIVIGLDHPREAVEISRQNIESQKTTTVLHGNENRHLNKPDDMLVVVALIVARHFRIDHRNVSMQLIRTDYPIRDMKKPNRVLREWLTNFIITVRSKRQVIRNRINATVLCRLRAILTSTRIRSQSFQF